MKTQDKGVYWRGFNGEGGINYYILSDCENIEIKAAWELVNGDKEQQILEMKLSDLPALIEAISGLVNAIEKGETCQTKPN